MKKLFLKIKLFFKYLGKEKTGSVDLSWPPKNPAYAGKKITKQGKKENNCTGTLIVDNVKFNPNKIYVGGEIKLK